MNVTSLRYQPIEGGALGGHFALHVTLGASDGPGVPFTPTMLSTKIHEVFEILNLQAKVKGVLVDCREADLVPLTTGEMTSFLSTLKDWGVTVIVWVNEGTRYAWFDPSQYIVVFVTHQHWPNFRVNEIRYVMPQDPAKWIEPDVYDVNAAATCYLVPTEKQTKAAPVIDFVTKCKRPWGIIRDIVAISFKLKDE